MARTVRHVALMLGEISDANPRSPLAITELGQDYFDPWSASAPACGQRGAATSAGCRSTRA